MLTPESLTLDLEQNRIPPVYLTGMLVALQRKITRCKLLLSTNRDNIIAGTDNSAVDNSSSLHTQIADTQELLDIIYYYHPELLL